MHYEPSSPIHGPNVISLRLPECEPAVAESVTQSQSWCGTLFKQIYHSTGISQQQCLWNCMFLSWKWAEIKERQQARLMGCRGERVLSSVHSQYFDIKLKLRFMEWGEFRQYTLEYIAGWQIKGETKKCWALRKFPYTGIDLQVSGGVVQRFSERYSLTRCFDGGGGERCQFKMSQRCLL